MKEDERTTHEPAARRRRIVLGLWLALLACMLVNVALLALLYVRGETLDGASTGVGLSLTPELLKATGHDSWKPMAVAWERERQFPGQMYWVFLVKHVRFQYPPSALLLMNFVPLPLTLEVKEKLAVPSLIAVLLTIGFSLGILLRLSPKAIGSSVGQRGTFAGVCTLLVACLGLTFWPLTKGHHLGQIQVYVGASVACALFARAHNQRGLCGACLGLCCLMKPQYGLVVLWALLRREFKLLVGWLTVVTIGLAISVREFGLENHFEYLKVLRELSRRGESFWPNQSMNGLLHRFLPNGEAIRWIGHSLPPYHPVVYYGTLASSAVLLSIALFWPAARRWRGSVLDLSVLLAGATLASPIAWEHHYGIFFPIFAVALPFVLASPLPGILLVLSYAAISTELIRPELLLPSRWKGLLISHIFFGGLILFAVLVARRARHAWDERLSR